MSAIAHWIEQHGINTVVIGLVRLHLEKMLPPRSLWVPFELGRPLGAPNDMPQQQSVLLQGLQMVESTTTNQIIDFDSEDSRSESDLTWQPPLINRDRALTVTQECTQLKPDYDRHVTITGRTSVGVTGIPVEQCAALLDYAIDNRAAAASPRAEISNVLMLRLAMDDIKAYYAEAGLGKRPGQKAGQRAGARTGERASGSNNDNSEVNPAPSSRQLSDWFWLDTSTGSHIRQLREQLIVSDDSKLEGLARRFMIPHRWRLSD